MPPPKPLTKPVPCGLTDYFGDYTGNTSQYLEDPSTNLKTEENVRYKNGCGIHCWTDLFAISDQYQSTNW